MFILYSVLVALVIGIVDVLLFAKDKKPSTVAYHLISDTVLSTIFTLFVTINLLGKNNILVGFHPGKLFILKYLLVTLAISLVVVLVKAFLGKKLYFEKDDKKKKNSKGAMAVKVISTILVFFGVAAFAVTVWGIATYGEIPLDQMLITMTSPASGTSNEIYNSAFEGPLLTTVTVTALFAILVFPDYKMLFSKDGKKAKTILTEFVKRMLSLLLAVAMFIGGCAYGIIKYSLLDFIKANYIESTYIEDNYVDPKTANITFPEKKRNLIHIYLESVENTYFSKDLGGDMDVNLMPDLQKLSSEGYSFSHTENTFGGPTPNTGGTWSAASMLNQSSGVPMKFTQTPHYGSDGDFLGGATMIGDILAEQGYEQSLMFGADATFAGLNFMYDNHGKFNILDYQAAKDKGWIPADYSVWWGYEDDKLYEFAKAEITRLSQTGKPFNFVMENADTHFPDGYLSENATEQVHESQYGNVIYYSQGEVYKFVKWIQEQPFYENTTVILIGDHLSMDANFFDNYVDDDYERTTYNLILNPAPEAVENMSNDRLYNRRWANFDMFPTILTSIGAKIEGDHLGMGTNLFSDEQTLFERDGVRYVNNEVEKYNRFYNEQLLLEKPKK